MHRDLSEFKFKVPSLIRGSENIQKRPEEQTVKRTEDHDPTQRMEKRPASVFSWKRLLKFRNLKQNNKNQLNKKIKLSAREKLNKLK
ncbi:hypothetical protein DPMN_105871 [Dreissena polymorpha]|uniref:Uncharacterized protein n=1 Tax=Dreissena polymorpha TaxID=45954 RepID=A0A9D4K422_DREPO|nr:hypothetical protein DPMN_105871 [Dreissena polymorpha]